jgi:hypothetical protein
VLGVVAGMWRTYQDRNAIASVQDLDLRLLEDALQGKVANPLAAAIAGLVLLRARRFDLLHDRWLRNLSDWLPDLPDGAVLWAEQLRLQGGRDRGRSAAERLEYLAGWRSRGHRAWPRCSRWRGGTLLSSPGWTGRGCSPW